MFFTALRSVAGRRGFALFAVLLLAGCAAAPGKRDPHDPWERMNRATYKFNDTMDRAFVKPIAVGYKKAVLRPVRIGIGNFLGNLGYTRTMVNDLLQAKFKAFASDTGRFVLNSTVGIGGILDPASDAGLPRNEEDFGQTLGRWGVKPGPYLMLPLLGPSSVRDTIGIYPDWKTDLKENAKDPWMDFTLAAVALLVRRVELLNVEDTYKNAYDPYVFIRNAYLQHREYQVTDGEVEEQPTEEEPIDEDEATSPDSPQGP